ncbi:hypothetical protein [Limnohabitans sp.]|uniref:hypothetical protein n=1 Tax=Limnohabitans sp. TaxID=1907725 RepID=UPI00286F9BE6|nr:hypothetical protein [Limnohabitans sp.]
MNDLPLDPDINYLQGQIHALKAAVLNLARQSTLKEEFQEELMQRIEAQRTAALSEPVADSTLAGIDVIETWLLTSTAP